jgi:hypothetical protein
MSMGKGLIRMDIRSNRCGFFLSAARYLIR